MSREESSLEHYQEKGYIILRDVLDASEVEELRSTLQPYLDLDVQGRNNFEGEKTQRVYSLVGRGKVFERTVEHPRVLEFLSRFLEPGYLLTASQAICIRPGETPQPLHTDDKFYKLERPRKAVSISTIWALDAFTAENGGTEVIEGSHLWSDDQVSKACDSPTNLKAIEMDAGSLVIFAGTLLHRGGGNSATTMRRAFSNQYCEPWARQQENFMVSIPGERVSKMSRVVQEMLGYSIYPPFMGQLAGRHPQKSLAKDYVNSLIVDDDEIGLES